MLPTCFLSVVGADKVLHSFFFKLNGVEEVLAKWEKCNTLSATLVIAIHWFNFAAKCKTMFSSRHHWIIERRELTQYNYGVCFKQFLMTQNAFILEPESGRFFASPRWWTPRHETDFPESISIFSVISKNVSLSLWSSLEKRKLFNWLLFVSSTKIFKLERRNVDVLAQSLSHKRFALMISKPIFVCTLTLSYW